MNHLQKCLILLTVILGANKGSAQETCKVLLPALSGHYEGNCKKGNAWGSGKAQGEDMYIGEFKNGLPDGKGVYKWKNGDIYEGKWLNGKMEGAGTRSYKINGKPDSVVTGFWGKDKYIGKNEKPYKILFRSSQVVKSDVKFSSSNLNEIVIMVRNESGNMATARDEITPKASLTDISVYKGRYARLLNHSETNKQTVYKLEDVYYPFRAKFIMGTQEVDIEFFEAGKYSLDIALIN